MSTDKKEKVDQVYEAFEKQAFDAFTEMWHNACSKAAKEANFPAGVELLLPFKVSHKWLSDLSSNWYQLEMSNHPSNHFLYKLVKRTPK